MSDVRTKVEQARSLLLAGKAEQARLLGVRLLKSDTADPHVADLMAQIFIHLRQSEQALHYARRATELAPGDLGFMHNLGVTLLTLQRADEAAAILGAILEKDPRQGSSRLAYLSALLQQRQHARIIQVCEEGRRLHPGNPVFEGVRASALLSQGLADESYEALRSMLAHNAQEPGLRNTLAQTSNYVPGLTPAQIFAEHKAYGDLLERMWPATRRTFTNPRDPEKRLRVGILSPDLRTHSVAFFIEPFVQGHDRAGFELIAYQTNRTEDAVTVRLRKGFGAWHDCSALGDEALIGRLLADKLDVLIELSGHMQAHRLPVMHMRAAPVQATYIGYPNTTGVRAMDARFVDSITDPAGEADACASERLVRLDPCFLCYRPPADAPKPAMPRGDGPVTFGSFNALQKINPPLVHLWARVLQAVPGSVLLLKSWNLADRGSWAEFTRRFTDAGIDETRLQLCEPIAGIAEHLAAYSRVDVALDTFPYHGTTTTCEALWMGVPVVTLAGDRHASRVGASLLHAAGLPDLVAKDEEAYVHIATSLAGHATRRAHLRATLRDDLRAGPLCDEASYCRRLESALRGLWRQWCQTQTIARPHA
ncbi:MAG: hypothetical protein IPM33_04285 [Phycisphaerales bacterium]|nr:hypothetical protein [Phycisphaerales bacterium]